MKKSSFNRIIPLVKNRTIYELAIIQSAYINKDENTLRQLFNNYSAKPQTIFAYGNLVNQYITLLSKPTKQFSQYIDKNYNVQVQNSSNLSDNLRVNSDLVFNAKKVDLVPFPLSPNRKIVSNWNIEVDSVVQFLDIDINAIWYSFFRNFPSLFRKFNKKNNNKFKRARLTFRYKLNNNKQFFFSTKLVPINLFISECIKAFDSVLGLDKQNWEQISPKNEDLIDELYDINSTTLISEYNYSKIEYRI